MFVVLGCIRKNDAVARQEAFDLMRASGKASVINLSSVMSAKHTRQMAVYSATKFGLRGFSLALREDLRGTGVHSSVVMPGNSGRESSSAAQRSALGTLTAFVSANGG